MSAGESDHLPRRHVSVAAIDRIGQKAVLGVFQDELEEFLAVGSGELERTVFETLDRFVLLDVRQRGENLAAELVAARLVECGQCLAIMLRRRHRRLRALLFGALLERSGHVVAVKTSIWTGELSIDIDGAAAILAAGRKIVSRNETIDKRFDCPGFLRREVMPAVRRHARRRVGCPRFPRYPASDDCGTSGRRTKQNDDRAAGKELPPV